MTTKDNDKSMKAAVSPAAEPLTDAELDAVVGAGDPLPYPDIDGGDGGGDSKIRISRKVSGDTSGSDEAGTLKGVSSPSGTGSTELVTYGGLDVKIEGSSVIKLLNRGAHN
jgi:hypothetical protein